MFVWSHNRGGSSGGRQEYFDKVSVLVTGACWWCLSQVPWVHGCRFWAAVLQRLSD